MKKDILFQMEEDVIEKFKLAVALAGKKEDAVIEDLMKDYIASSFSKVAIEYGSSEKRLFAEEQSKEEWKGKALNKIPIWADKQTQIPYRILRAFLQIENENGAVQFDALQERCSDQENYPDTYVGTFMTNFAQLKLDTAKSHGKVFEVEENVYVKLWPYVEEAIRNRRDKFLQLHTVDKGYVNSLRQMNMGPSGRKGTDHGQRFYHMICSDCGYQYEANGSDIFLKKCPNCQGGADSGRK